MGNILLGIVIGVIGSSIAWFFVAKNNKDKLIKIFLKVDELPADAKQGLKDYLKKFGINIDI